MKVSTVVSRMDMISLEKFIGQDVLSLVTEKEDMKPSKIKEMASSPSSEKLCLYDYEKAELILEFLKPEEKLALAQLLNINADNFSEDFEKVHRLNKLEKFFSFFEQEFVPQVIVEVPPVELVQPNRGLRPYQAQLINKFKKEFETNKIARVLLHLPTGAGKTRIAIRFLAEQLAFKGANFLWLANDNRLLRQAENEFKQAWKAVGDVDCQILRVSRHMNLDLLDGNMKSALFCTVQTYHEMIKADLPLFREIPKHINFVVFDEAHQVIADTYKNVVSSICFYANNAFLIGLTATPGRSNLDIEADRQLKEFFQGNKIKLSTSELGYSNPFQYLIDKKYLATPHFTPLDFDSKSISKRDFLYQKLTELAGRYKKILVFCDSIKEIDIIAASLRLKFPNSFGVHSKNSVEENIMAINKLRDKEITEPVIVLNFDMLTTGFDAPGIDCLVVAKTTNSVIEFSQMVGRGLRGPESGGSENVMVFHIQEATHSFYFDLKMMFEFWEGVWND